MKINLEVGKETPKAKRGDLIQFENKVIAIVGEYERNIFLLKNVLGDDWMRMSEGNFQRLYTEGKYTILARTDNWEINRIKGDSN